MKLGARDVAYFVAELAVYVAVAAAAWRAAWWLALLAVLAMAVWWGLLHSPRARYRLPRAGDIALRILWFGVGLAAVICVVLGR